MSGLGAWLAGAGGSGVLLACLFVLGWTLGWLGHDTRMRARARRSAERREEVRAARWLEGVRETRGATVMPPEPGAAALREYVTAAWPAGPPEVAHEWEPVHVGQALALTRDDLTDSAYTQDMAVRMDQFLEGLFAVPYSADELWSGQ